MSKKKYDFSGYATKNDLLCADGRTIKKDAFAHQDGETVPLVFHHIHNDIYNVLGHALLENREDGVYVYGSFNDTEAGQNAKKLVEHGDITKLSIYANNLVQKVKDVVHGKLVEVSLVMSGANPGAFIDNLSIAHGDGVVIDDTEAIIYTGLDFDHASAKHSDEETVQEIFDTFTEDQKEATYAMIAHAAGELTDDEFVELTLEHADGEDQTVQEIFDTLTDVQKNVVYAMIGYAIESSAEHSDIDQNGSDTDVPEQNEDETQLEHSDKGGNVMKKNAFDREVKDQGYALTHADLKSIFDNAQKSGSLKSAVLAHADGLGDALKHDGTYGIDNIDYLFPDAKTIYNEPDFISRRMEWVNSVLGAVSRSPFARIKTVHADITANEARAKGYVKANQKVEEVFSLLKRITTPTTIYKKQKLDRDDIIDIVDMDVVRFVKTEMRVMLDEEIARAILIGDGRSIASEDKISETNIRPIYTDDALYCYKLQLADDATIIEQMEAIIKSRKEYKGSGSPVLYTTTDFVTDMLLTKDDTGRRLYKSVAEVAEDLRVSKIVEVEVMEGVSRTVVATEYDLLGIIVNLRDYTVGADKGGAIGMFDDFDIDYNQYKYLIETRMCGALNKPKSAITVEKVHGH